MGLIDLFSKRQKRARGEVPDVYQYDEIPHELRVSLTFMLQEAFRLGHFHDFGSHLETIVRCLRKEYGRPQLADAYKLTDELLMFIVTEKDVERVLDPIELAVKAIEYLWHKSYKFSEESTSPDAFVRELNGRFREHGVGYEFTDGRILRVDSQFIHTEAVKPALKLLRDPLYKGAQEEFLKAHEHYRHGRNKECLNDCLKAFESTMKSICDKRGWAYDKGKDTSSKLVKAVLDNKLLPPYLESQIGAMRSLLTSGIPTVRNKKGGHGQGQTPVPVHEDEASYVLNLTATTILMLVQSEQKLA